MVVARRCGLNPQQSRFLQVAHGNRRGRISLLEGMFVLVLVHRVLFLFCFFVLYFARTLTPGSTHVPWSSCSGGGVRMNPFRAAVPFWGQTTSNLTGLPPERDCASERVKSDQKRRWTHNPGIPLYVSTLDFGSVYSSSIFPRFVYPPCLVLSFYYIFARTSPRNCELQARLPQRAHRRWRKKNRAARLSVALAYRPGSQNRTRCVDV